jgi:4-hydroxybenzoate polyprenyltransferase
VTPGPGRIDTPPAGATASTRTPLALHRFGKTLLFALKLSRPGFWLTAAWFYLFPLGQSDLWATPRFWFGLFFVMFPFGLFIYGWNDFMDAAADRSNPRKGGFLFGPQATEEERCQLPWIIALVHLPLLCYLGLAVNSRFVWWYLLLAGATAIYNLPRWGFKNWPVLDVLNQAGYLLAFTFSSWINGAPMLHAGAMTFGVMFAMHSHLLGQIMDLEPDRQAGRCTTAVWLGRSATKYLIAGMMIGECLLVFRLGDAFIASFLAMGVLWFLADARLLFGSRPYPRFLMRLFLIGWNAAAVVSAPWVWIHGSFVH